LRLLAELDAKIVELRGNVSLRITRTPSMSRTLMSRCTTPFECMYSSARTSCLK
jgi:hypothetical protein